MVKNILYVVLFFNFFVSTQLQSISTGIKVATPLLGGAALAGESYLLWKKAERLAEISHILDASELPGRVPYEKHTWNYKSSLDYSLEYRQMARPTLVKRMKPEIIKGLQSFLSNYSNLNKIELYKLYKLFLVLADQDLTLLESFRHELKGDRNFLVQRWRTALNNTVYRPIKRRIMALYKKIRRVEDHLRFMILVVKDELRI